MASEDSKAAAVAGMVGGFLWALTPLRQPIFGAGRTPDEGEQFFRGYNAVLVLIALSLTWALLRLGREARHVTSRPLRVGWWLVLLGHVLLLAGSLLAVLGASPRHVVAMGQDAAFLGAVLAAAGAIFVGAAGYRRGVLPVPAAALFVAALPLGLLMAVVIGAMGAPQDVVGLPLTVLYGAAWIALGIHWIGARAASRRPVA